MILCIIVFYRIANRDIFLKGHKGKITSLAFSFDGKLLASASEDDTVKIWDVNRRKEVRTLSISSRVKSVAFFPNRSTLVTCGRMVRFWNAETGQELKSVASYDRDVDIAVFSPDGHILALGGRYAIILWNMVTGKRIEIVKVNDGDRLASLAFSPDGRYLVSGWHDKIRNWDIKSKKEVYNIKAHFSDVASLVVSPNGKLLASGSDDTTIKLWDLKSGKVLITIEGHIGWLRALTIMPAGKILISTGYDGMIKFWNIDNGKAISSYGEISSPINSMVLSSAGDILATGGYAGEIQLRDVSKYLD